MKPSVPRKPARAAKRSATRWQPQPDPNRYAVDYMDHAPVWPSPIFAPGLFRPTQNGAASTPLEVRFNAKVDGARMRYVLRSPEALNMTDQAVYFHLCQRIAARKWEAFEATHERAAPYLAAIGAAGLWADKPLLVVTLTLSDLADGIGLTRTGTNAKAMFASLCRLSLVTMARAVLNEDGAVARSGSGRFLAFLSSDTGVHVVLHWESSLLACKHNGVAWVNMREYRSLRGKPAKRLHAWMTAWASDKSAKPVGLDSLMFNVWGDKPKTPDIRKDRKRTLRKAIDEVAKLAGWSCVYTEKGDQLLVRKPGFVGTTAQQATLEAAAKTAAVAATPTHRAATPTKPAATATKVAATPTAVSAKAAPSAEVNELVFEL